MATSPFSFTPSNGLRDTTTYPTTPASEAAARNQFQQGPDQLRDYINGTLIPAVDSKLSPGNAVDLTTNQTVGGNKTFSSIVTAAGVSSTNPDGLAFATGSASADPANHSGWGIRASSTGNSVDIISTSVPRYVPASGSSYIPYNILHTGSHKHNVKVVIQRYATSTASTSNTSYGEGATGTKPFIFTASEWSTTTFYVEAAISISGPYTAYVGLWDFTAGAAVTGSEVSTTSTTGATLRSGAITLVDGHKYGFYIRSSSASGTAACYGLDVVMLS